MDLLLLIVFRISFYYFLKAPIDIRHTVLTLTDGVVEDWSKEMYDVLMWWDLSGEETDFGLQNKAVFLGVVLCNEQ